MNVRPRLLTNSFVTVKTVMTKKTKPPTHYETLEVNPRATQSEIKSAYFKLSKQYHPDKNSSDEAVTKFRDVSDAYEILGSYESRKKYDRSVLTHTSYSVRQATEKQADPRIQYYQSQAAVFRQDSKSGSTPHYDFDAWTKAHYGRTLNRTLRDKKQSAHRRSQHEPIYQPPNRTDFGLAVFAVVFISLLIMLNMDDEIEGKFALTMSQRQEIEGQDTSGTEFGETKANSLQSE